MAENTTISWAHHTFNPWWGCRKVSPACRFCYAARDSKRYGFDAWGSKGQRRMLSDDTWAKPLKWNRAAERSGEQVRVFCASMADVFEDHPALVEPRQRLWGLIEQTPALTWMLLTKRPQNVADMVPWGERWPRSVWLGVSAENQRFAHERIPLLLQQPAAIRFVSAAPLLGPLDLSRWLTGRPVWGEEYPEPTSPAGMLVQDLVDQAGVDWVITEGESGPRARPSHPDWFRSIRDQCLAAGVAFHHKQNGEWQDGSHDPRTQRGVDHVIVADGRHEPWVGHTRDGGRPATDLARARLRQEPGTDRAVVISRVGLKAAGRKLDGVVWDQFPREAVTT